MMLKPLHNNVVIEPTEAEKKTASGIILSGDAAQSKHAEGVVVAVGPGKWVDDDDLLPMSVAVGDRVVYGGYSQTMIEHEGKDLVILTEDNILAVIE